MQFLEEIESEVKQLKIASKYGQELFNSIINCKTNVSYELDKIASWFQIKETKIIDFEVSKAIDTSLEITNKISKNCKLILRERNLSLHTIIKGEYFIDFFDLLTIFFDNMVKYSNLPTEDLLIEVTAFEKENNLKIILTNNLNPDIDIKNLKEKLEQKQKELDSPNWDMEKIKKEEGTGFFKAKKILTTDLQNERNSFTFSVTTEQEFEVQINICLLNIKI